MILTIYTRPGRSTAEIENRLKSIPNLNIKIIDISRFPDSHQLLVHHGITPDQLPVLFFGNQQFSLEDVLTIKFPQEIDYSEFEDSRAGRQTDAIIRKELKKIKNKQQ
jgi:hypothetical protein